MNFEKRSGEPAADYDADFSGDIPLLLNIWNKNPGTGEGYEALKKFIDQVGPGKNFLATAMTDAGAHLFEKAVRDGLIIKLADLQGTIIRRSEWRVV